MREGESLLFMSSRFYLTTSEYHTFIPIGFKDVCFQSMYMWTFSVVEDVKQQCFSAGHG